MRIVPTGVHDALHFGAGVMVRVFMNRKRIDICTKSDRFSWFSSSEYNNNPCRCGKVNIDSSEGMKTLRNE